MYSADISRNNPTMILFLLDQSGSMSDNLGSETAASGLTKANALADAINRLIQNFCIKCAKEEGVRDYFHIGVIGYGEEVGSAFLGSLKGKDLVPISEVANKPYRIDMRSKKVSDGAGGLIEHPIKFPIWFDPTTKSGTPMCGALEYACGITENWLKDHPKCFPPLVINITDGESTDGDPSAIAAILRALYSEDGEVLLFNLHLSSQNKKPITFPDSESQLPDQFAKLLFQMSSNLTKSMLAVANQEGYGVKEGARGFAFNADLVEIIKFLDIGTRPSNLR